MEGVLSLALGDHAKNNARNIAADQVALRHNNAALKNEVGDTQFSFFMKWNASCDPSE